MEKQWRKFIITTYNNTPNHAMLQQMKSPPAEFKDAIEAHFILKRPHVGNFMEEWLSEIIQGTDKDEMQLLLSEMKVELDELCSRPGQSRR